MLNSVNNYYTSLKHRYETLFSKIFCSCKPNIIDSNEIILYSQDEATSSPTVVSLSESSGHLDHEILSSSFLLSPISNETVASHCLSYLRFDSDSDLVLYDSKRLRDTISSSSERNFDNISDSEANCNKFQVSNHSI